jgi:hypothetical protein
MPFLKVFQTALLVVSLAVNPASCGATSHTPLSSLRTLAEGDDHNHDHDHGIIEWAGIFETPESSYIVWIAQKVDPVC